MYDTFHIILVGWYVRSAEQKVDNQNTIWNMPRLLMIQLQENFFPTSSFIRKSLKDHQNIYYFVLLYLVFRRKYVAKYRWRWWWIYVSAQQLQLQSKSSIQAWIEVEEAGERRKKGLGLWIKLCLAMPWLDRQKANNKANQYSWDLYKTYISGFQTLSLFCNGL